jgi:dUTP pyrophosphatase
MVTMELRRIHENAKLPYHGRETDAGYDLSASVDVIIPPQSFHRIPTGIQISPPEGWYYLIVGRSSMWIRGLMTNVGVVDTGYCGELFICVYNMSGSPCHIKAGERVGQILPQEAANIKFREVEEFSEGYSHRGENGWGSSNK